MSGLDPSATPTSFPIHIRLRDFCDERVLLESGPRKYCGEVSSSTSCRGKGLQCFSSPTTGSKQSEGCPSKSQPKGAGDNVVTSGSTKRRKGKAWRKLETETLLRTKLVSKGSGAVGERRFLSRLRKRQGAERHPRGNRNRLDGASISLDRLVYLDWSQLQSDTSFSPGDRLQRRSQMQGTASKFTIEIKQFCLQEKRGSPPRITTSIHPPLGSLDHSMKDGVNSCYSQRLRKADAVKPVRRRYRLIRSPGSLSLNTAFTRRLRQLGQLSSGRSHLAIRRPMGFVSQTWNPEPMARSTEPSIKHDDSEDVSVEMLGDEHVSKIQDNLEISSTSSKDTTSRIMDRTAIGRSDNYHLFRPLSLICIDSKIDAHWTASFRELLRTGQGDDCQDRYRRYPTENVHIGPGFPQTESSNELTRLAKDHTLRIQIQVPLLLLQIGIMLLRMTQWLERSRVPQAFTKAIRWALSLVSIYILKL